VKKQKQRNPKTRCVFEFTEMVLEFTAVSQPLDGLISTFLFHTKEIDLRNK
jgi:hypothetical protein